MERRNALAREGNAVTRHASSGFGFPEAFSHQARAKMLGALPKIGTTHLNVARCFNPERQPNSLRAFNVRCEVRKSLWGKESRCNREFGGSGASLGHSSCETAAQSSSKCLG